MKLLFWIVLFYLAAVNLFAFIRMGQDKSSAIRGAERTPEAFFLLLTVLGGGAGVLSGMLAFRHKTLHLKFTVGVPVLMGLEAAALYGLVSLYRSGKLLLTAVLLLLIAGNAVWFLLTGRDKQRSRQKNRTLLPNSVFLFWGLAGCAAGIFLGTRYFHHKTTKIQYRVVMPLVAVCQLALILLAAFCL